MRYSGPGASVAVSPGAASAGGGRSVYARAATVIVAIATETIAPISRRRGSRWRTILVGCARRTEALGQSSSLYRFSIIETLTQDCLPSQIRTRRDEPRWRSAESIGTVPRLSLATRCRRRTVGRTQIVRG